MNHGDGRGILGNWEATGEQIRRAMGHAIAKTLSEHKEAGRSVVMWDREHDRIVIVPPDEINVPEAVEETNGSGPNRDGSRSDPASMSTEVPPVTTS